MQSFEFILLTVGVLIIVGFFVAALWRTRRDNADSDLNLERDSDLEAPDLDEPTISATADHGVESQTIEPIIIETKSREPKKVYGEFETSQTISMPISNPVSDTGSTQKSSPSAAPILGEISTEYADEEPFVVSTASEKRMNKTMPDADNEPQSDWMQTIRKTFKHRTEDYRAAQEAQKRPPSGLIVLYVVAPRGKSFYGVDIANLLEDQGLRFGVKDVFHKTDDFGREIFSVASAVEPGTFDYDNMALSSTPGLCCFFDLDAVENAKQSFRSLLSCVYEMAHFFRAEILDENREPLTQASVGQSLAKIKSTMKQGTMEQARPVNVE